MKLSYVIVTHNRREPLLKTLALLQQHTPLPESQWETWVVDNASTDGTIEAVKQQFPAVKLIAREDNEGVAARSHAFQPAAGQYLILLDDDSYPIGNTVADSIAYLDAHPTSAALVGKVILPDGSFEACALPAVMLSGAVCIRRSVLLEVGPFREEFFRKAGEYDLSYRIWQAGYSVDRFEDIYYRHDKVLTGRSTALAHRMDLRNNLILVERYLPAPMRRAYRRDYLHRYSHIARAAGESAAASQAIAEARNWARRERDAGRQILNSQVLEKVFEWGQQARLVQQWADTHQPRHVVIADYGKNLYATYRACQRAGLHVTGIAANGNAFRGASYRGIPIVSYNQALIDPPDGVIVSNINPAQIDGCVQQVKQLYPGPVLRLWEPTCLHSGSSKLPDSHAA